MSRTNNNMNTKASATTHAGNAQGKGGDYYSAYYRELVTRGASRVEGRRRLEEIKTERRRVRRERCLNGIKSLVSVLISSEVLG